MEPVTLAVITSAVVSLASKVLEGTANAAGESLWQQVRGILGFAQDPKPEDLALLIAEKLKDNDALASSILKTLQAEPNEVPCRLVGNIDADKVIVIGKQNVAGDVNIQM